MSYYRQQLEDYLSNLEIKCDLVYDIGGAQGAVAKRVQNYEVKDTAILDLPDYDLDKEWPDGSPKADMIFCLEVFEYLINPVTAIKNIAKLLKDGGTAIVTFAFVYPHHNELENEGLRYTERAIERLAEISGLKIYNITYYLIVTGKQMQM